MNFSLYDLYNELYDGYKNFLKYDCPELSDAHRSSLANRFAVKNTWHLFHYKKPVDAFKFTDDNVKKAFGISGHIRLWLCHCTDDNLVFGYDAGNGNYVKVTIKS